MKHDYCIYYGKAYNDEHAPKDHLIYNGQAWGWAWTIWGGGREGDHIEQF